MYLWGIIDRINRDYARYNDASSIRQWDYLPTLNHFKENPPQPNRINYNLVSLNKRPRLPTPGNVSRWINAELERITMTSSPSSGPQNAQEIQFDSVTSRSRYVPGARFYRNVAIYRSRRRDASVRRCLRRIDVTGGAEERNTRSSDSFGVIAMVLITGKCSRHFHSCLHDLPIAQ